MGCDIHAYGEVKIKGKWIGLGQVGIKRDYRLFTRMANVRNYYDEEITPIAEPRGFPPERVSDLVLLEWELWEADGHSISYLTHREVGELEKWCEEAKVGGTKLGATTHYWSPMGWLFGNNWGDYFEYPEEDSLVPKGFEDARLIFWFDN